jgi:hypothetical protein
MEFLVTMENKTSNVEICQMVAISKDQISRIRGGNSCGNSHGGGGYPDDVSIGDNGPGLD